MCAHDLRKGESPSSPQFSSIIFSCSEPGDRLAGQQSHPRLCAGLSLRWHNVAFLTLNDQSLWILFLSRLTAEVVF